MSAIKEIYNRIGQRITDTIADEWKEAKLSIEYVGSVKTSLTYKTPDGNIKSEFLADSFKNSRDIKELHSTMTLGGKNKWNKAIFVLSHNGKFDMEFSWDQNLQDETEGLSKD